MLGLRRVAGQVGGGEDRAEEEPVAQVARQQVGVLALPAEAGGLGEGFSITGAVSTKTLISAPVSVTSQRPRRLSRDFTTSW